MRNYKHHVGIDVSKKKIDVAVLLEVSEKKCNHFVVSNNVQGFKIMIRQLKNQNIDLTQALFCFENTGVYSMSLSIFFSELKIDYWIVPAIEIKRSKGLARGKSDKADSKDIAFYAYTHQHKVCLTQFPEKDILQLKLLFTEREKLIKVVQLFETTNENKGFLPKDVLKDLLKINTKTIQHLKNSLQQVESKMNEIIDNNSSIKKQMELLKSIPGLGQQTAVYLIITTKGFQSFKNWRQMACYAGVAPFEYTSGSSIKGKTQVNHLADKKLKSLLNMCALTSIKYDKDIKNYYERKVADGKNKMLVINNVRCKMLARAFAIINRQTPYVNLQKFAA